jgi:hypothetical protein
VTMETVELGFWGVEGKPGVLFFFVGWSRECHAAFASDILIS